MKKFFTLLLISATMFGAKAQNRTAAAFTPGNVVVVRVGTGAAALSNASTAAFLDEYSPAGVLVQSIPLPTATSGTNRALTLGGTATTEGMITRSANGNFLLVGGYDVAPGTASVGGTASATVNRVVGVIDAAGTINTTTALTDVFTGQSIRSVTSPNGTDFYLAGGSQGVVYAQLAATSGTVISSTVTNLRAINIYDNQLYASTASGSNSRVVAIGTGVSNATGQTATALPGIPTTGSPYQFFFADLNPAIPGVDVLYIADDASTTGIQKYSFTGSTWVANGTLVPTSTGTRGLTGVVVGTTVTLYTTTATTLSSLVDASGYNSNITGTFTTLATASTNTAFRGVALAPTPIAAPLNLTSFSASLVNNAARLNWTSQNEVNVRGFSVEKSLNGRDFSEIAFVNATNRTSANYTAEDANLKAGANYYRLKMIDLDGSVRYSSVAVINNRSGIKVDIFPNPVINSLSVSHDKANAGAVIRILNMEGKQVKVVPVQAGALQTNLAVNELVKGNYLLVLEQDGQKVTSKFTKQ